jgi:hypothetical protein
MAISGLRATVDAIIKAAAVQQHCAAVSVAAAASLTEDSVKEQRGGRLAEGEVQQEPDDNKMVPTSILTVILLYRSPLKTTFMHISLGSSRSKCRGIRSIERSAPSPVTRKPSKSD